MHFILDCEPGWPLRQGPDVDEPWTEGQKLVFPPDEPLRYTIEPQIEGEPAAMYEGLAPVWSEDLVAALREAGVHNLEISLRLYRTLPAAESGRATVP